MDRRITAVKKDRQGNIVALCNPSESWSPRKAIDVMKDIGSGMKSYYVQQLPKRTYLRLISGNLQTTKDATNGNSLTNLPILD
jgi:hypothetical protein